MDSRPIAIIWWQLEAFFTRTVHNRQHKQKRVTKYYEKEGCSIHWDVCTPPSNIFISCLMFITGVLGVLKVSVSIVLHFLDLVVAVTHLMTMMMMVIEVKTNGEQGKSSLLAAAVLKFREGKKKNI